MCSIYDSGFKRLAAQYGAQFEKQGESFLFDIGRFKSIRGCLLELYWILLKEGMEPVEKLPEHEKRELWAEACRLCEDPAARIHTAKALHAFGTFLNIIQ